MDLSLILFIVGIIFVIVMIFKFIKKIIFAIISVCFFLFLIVAGIGLIVYLDLSNLSDQKDFDVNLLYGEVDSPILGTYLPIENQSFNISNLRSINLGTYNKEVLDDLDDGQYYIYLSEDLFGNMLSDTQKYFLEGTKNIKISGIVVDASLNKNDVIRLLDSKDALDEYVDIIYSKNKFGNSNLISKSLIKDYIESETKKFDLNFKDIVFLSIFISSFDDKENILNLVQGFKDDELSVYPYKLTFRLIKMLPVDTLQGLIPVSEN